MQDCGFGEELGQAKNFSEPPINQIEKQNYVFKKERYLRVKIIQSHQTEAFAFCLKCSHLYILVLWIQIIKNYNKKENITCWVHCKKNKYTYKLKIKYVRLKITFRKLFLC